ncbi:phosphate-selective porin O and P family protein [Polaribacter sp. Hel1_85]|nr:phosphate-selective porin O and P family protein [Polaribacter sp. Hel1_85]
MILYNLGSIAQENKKNDSIRLNQYGQKVSWLSLHGEVQEGILKFTSDDNSYSLWLDNRVQFDGAFFSNDALNPIGNGATIRRARFAIKAIMWNNWYAELDLDFSGSAVELKDAYLKYTFDSGDLNIKAGHFRESFGMETTTTSRYITFMERSLASKLDPSRHLGLQANYWKEKYLLSGGIHFNTVGDLEEFEISQDHNKDLGLDEGYAFTGRAVYRPIIENEKVLHFGIAATYRTPQTTAEVPHSFRYSTRSHSSINRKKYIDTDDILNVDYQTMFDFELAGAYKGFMFQGEYKLINISRIDDLSTINFDGFYAQAGYLLFGGKYNYNKTEGEFTRITRGKEYGDLELAFRYDFVDANDFDAAVYGGSAEGYTLGLNYHFNPNVKFMLNYAYNNNDRYANGKGKLYVGYDVDGNLSTDPSKITETEGNAGDDFGMVSMRLEIDF